MNKKLFILSILLISILPSQTLALTCSVDTTCSGIVVFKMSSTSNAHAELPTQTNYGYYVCCSDSGLGNSCSGNYAVALRLSSDTNAHVEKNTFSNYPNQVCLSTSTGSVDCNYASDCTTLGSNYVCLASISSDTNAHVGDCNAYQTKVCCSIGVSPPPQGRGLPEFDWLGILQIIALAALGFSLILLEPKIRRLGSFRRKR